MHIIPAAARYYAIVPSGDDDDFDKTPIIGFAWRGEGVPAVITPEGCPPRFVVEYPNGRIFSPASMQHFDSADAFIEQEGFSNELAALMQVTVTDHSPRLRDLGVSGRACAPLERQGIQTLADLSRCTKGFIADVKGVSRESVAEMEEHLHAAGLDWAGAVKPSTTVEDEPSADDDDDLSEVL